MKIFNKVQYDKNSKRVEVDPFSLTDVELESWKFTGFVDFKPEKVKIYKMWTEDHIPYTTLAH